MVHPNQGPWSGCHRGSDPADGGGGDGRGVRARKHSSGDSALAAPTTEAASPRCRVDRGLPSLGPGEIEEAMANHRIPDHLQIWIDARKRFRLSHAQVQMARELGLNPKKMGKLDNHEQEPWKLPLPLFIEHLYVKRFGKTRPDVVLSIEERIRLEAKKKATRREARRLSS